MTTQAAVFLFCVVIIVLCWLSDYGNDDTNEDNAF
jgi:preprotein translocase subunit SecG